MRPAAQAVGTAAVRRRTLQHGERAVAEFLDWRSSLGKHGAR